MQKHRCAYCRSKLDSYHVDHIVPLARGGRNDNLNLQVLCPACNHKKSVRDPITFVREEYGMLVMNNVGAIPLITPLNEAQQACVDLLTEALNEARSGAISSVGIIVCMKSGYATVMAGSAAADLNLGCDSLKRKIIDAVENDKRSIGRGRIVPARPAS
jgi:hypothetical protein